MAGQCKCLAGSTPVWVLLNMPLVPSGRQQELIVIERHSQIPDADTAVQNHKAVLKMFHRACTPVWAPLKMPTVPSGMSTASPISRPLGISSSRYVGFVAAMLMR